MIAKHITWTEREFSSHVGKIGGMELFRVDWTSTRKDPLPWKLSSTLPLPFKHPGSSTVPEAKRAAEHVLQLFVDRIGAEFSHPTNEGPVMTNPASVTIQETGSPSPSKKAGPCWIWVHNAYASTSPETIDNLTVGSTITAEGKVMVRRATRNDTTRNNWKLIVTGDPDDTVELSLGSPQSVDVTVTGVRHAEDAT